MIKNVRNTYRNTRVPLDNNEFVDCEFYETVLEYSGTGPVSLVQCKFFNPRWEFKGPALNTLQFLHGLYHGMGDVGRQLVESTFENIRQPKR